jgi:hypothetical protein
VGAGQMASAISNPLMLQWFPNRHGRALQTKNRIGLVPASALWTPHTPTGPLLPECLFADATSKLSERGLWHRLAGSPCQRKNST